MTPHDDMQANDMTQPQTDKLDDHHRQQLSAMLDGELLPDQAKFMLRRLEHDGELAACWERWQVCGEILRGRQGALLPADFSRRVADAIVDQRDAAPAAGAVVATARHPRWARWGGGAALAASVAMAALFVGRQAPAPGPEPVAPTQVVASTSMPARTPAVPSPGPAAPAPTQAPDAASTLATAVAAAEIPRRAAERRASRGQQQRAASRVRRAAQAPVTVAVAADARSAASPLAADASPAAAALAEAGPRPSATVTELFTTSPTQPRPWPRAILPGFPARDAFTVGYGDMAQEQRQERHPFHPFEPRMELQPALAEPQPAASGPR